MEQLCRVCMDSSVTLVDIFAERQRTTSKDPSLAVMLNEFCEVNPNDMLPQHICLSCVLAAQNAYKFKRTCLESNRRLLHMVAVSSKDDKEDAKCLLPFVEAVYHEERLTVDLSRVKTEPLYTQDVKFNEMPRPLLPVKVQPKSPQKTQQKIRPVNKMLGRKPQSMGEKPHMCRFCDKGFGRVYLLRLHEKRHTGEKTFFCNHCDKGFIRGHDLTIHTRIHTGERPFKCNLCPRSFIQNHILRAHMIQHSKKSAKQKQAAAKLLRKNIPATKSSMTKNSASKIPATKKNKQNIRENMQIKKEVPPTVLDRGLRDRLAPVTYEELDVDCELDLLPVLKTEPPNDMLYFSQNNYNSINIAANKNNRRESKKPKSKMTSKEKCLNAKTVHSCETCGKIFPRRYALTQHSRVHTGERPYKCPYCKLAFTQGQALKRHKRRLHSTLFQKETRLALKKESKVSPMKQLVVRLTRIQLPPNVMTIKCLD